MVICIMADVVDNIAIATLLLIRFKHWVPKNIEKTIR
jgi:hypothetical protein